MAGTRDHDPHMTLATRSYAYRYYYATLTGRRRRRMRA